jgi:hypothetical protein
MTLISVLLIMEWLRYHSCVQHRLEELNMHIDFHIIFWQVGWVI